jgi:hypothetical protein
MGELKEAENCVPGHMEQRHGVCHGTMLGERIRQTKHRMAGKIPDGRNRCAHRSSLDRVRFPRPGYGPVFCAAFPLEQVVF